ncbi:MAG: general L-amino acid transport system substrate-binding protein [Saliniramus fredricksonii]|uniref:General L-amino acid transport system substrate-binding protein n=1 Tax=Saliniramus fredricksonii TaxID=1653334 RepID=A0A0P7XQB3_9HYPH|nr:amino acid ABC transporter substrate-binding protein [Saliniramus fredricksonii]KPQ09742.1 MAG: general L-amino acid transport system substrate-binding protein [Saliniramus fredricksonii]SCC80711.1 general L-amino acid transport system substrate-binding protein [Saliniramus fredricksonii]
MLKKIVPVAATLAAALSYTTAASAQQTLETVQERGNLNCQVGLPTPGFYNLDSDGNWSGIDVDVCRAVAAAIFDDPEAVDFQSVTSAVRFTSLANGESDMLSRTTTWTAVRDTQLGLDFTTINFYDGQGFLVPEDSGITSTLELDGATVCVLTGTTTELNLADYFRANNMEFTPVTNENVNVLVETYLGGGCDAYTNDKSGLAARRSAFPNPDEHVILPETVSKEPLGPVVRNDDSAWADIVRWTLFGMIEAEELGVSSENVEEMLESDSPAIRRLLGVEGNIGEEMGLAPDFMVNVLRHVGNYGEIYEANIGEDTPVGIPRAGTQNDLWTRGGLIYAMPFR